MTVPFFFTICEEVIKAMSLRDKTNALFEAASLQDTTPEDMKSMIVELKSDPEFEPTGAVPTALQGALYIALMPDNDAESKRRLGVIRVIANAAAEYCGREYVRDVLEQSISRGNPESIVKILY